MYDIQTWYVYINIYVFTTFQQVFNCGGRGNRSPSQDLTFPFLCKSIYCCHFLESVHFFWKVFEHQLDMLDILWRCYLFALCGLGFLMGLPSSKFQPQRADDNWTFCTDLITRTLHLAYILVTSLMIFQIKAYQSISLHIWVTSVMIIQIKAYPCLS